MSLAARDHILVTGGFGLLGAHLREVLPASLYPSSSEFDIRNYPMMEGFLASKKVDTVVHCAAITSPPRVDKEPMLALDVNVVGTVNLVKLCHTMNARLVYISTDYVFDGEKGMYREEDPVNPVNKYAWSKLGGEAAVRMLDNSLIIRLSFGPEPFPYDKAFIDQWTSREPVSVVASKIVGLVCCSLTGVIHIGSARKSVMEYAMAIDRKRNIQALRRSEVKFSVPWDTSLNTSKYESYVGNIANENEREATR